MGNRSTLIRLITSVALLIVANATLVSLADAAPSEPSVEAAVLSKVDAGSPGSFELHRGLADVAREHSRAMAARKQLSHDGADDRPESAEPVPAERNGAPDDGHAPPSVSCENVAYVFPADKDPASEIYRLWLESPPHKACMDRTDTNVAGVGVYFDGERWWATYVAMTDRTPPSGKGSPSEEPSKTSKPAPKPKIEPVDESEDDVVVKAETGSTDDEPSFVAAPIEVAKPVRDDTDPEPTSVAEATVELPPVERVVAQALAPDLTEVRQHRQPLPQGALVLIIVLAALGMWFVWRTTVRTSPSVEPSAQ